MRDDLLFIFTIPIMLMHISRLGHSTKYFPYLYKAHSKVPIYSCRLEALDIPLQSNTFDHVNSFT